MAYTPEPLQSAELYYGDNTTSMTQINNVTSISVPDQAFGEIEWTHLGSTLQSFIPTAVREAGELQFTYQHQAAQYNSVGALEGVAGKYWKIELPDTNGTVIFQGFLKSNKEQDWSSPDDLGMVDCVVRLTSTITLTPGS